MDLPISAIRIGERRREDMGDIAGLAASIDKHGPFHPVVVDDDGNLIAGHRRLLAMQSLGWTMIPTRSLGELSEDERWECEQDENRQRKDWTPYENAKKRVEQAKADAPFISSNLEEKDHRGRKSTYGVPKEELAKAQGIGVAELVRNEQHVETADAYPFMRSGDWKEDHVLEARQHLQALPETDRAPAAALISQPGVPPQEAVKILGHIRHAEPEERQELYRMAESHDARERSDALAIPAGKPAMPDPRVVGFGFGGSYQ